MDEPKQDGEGVENILSSEPRIDGCYVAMNLAVNKQENPSPSNSLKETTSAPHGPFSNPSLLTRG